MKKIKYLLATSLLLTSVIFSMNAGNFFSRQAPQETGGGQWLPTELRNNHQLHWLLEYSPYSLINGPRYNGRVMDEELLQEISQEFRHFLDDPEFGRFLQAFAPDATSIDQQARHQHVNAALSATITRAGNGWGEMQWFAIPPEKRALFMTVLEHDYRLLTNNAVKDAMQQAFTSQVRQEALGQTLEVEPWFAMSANNPQFLAYTVIMAMDKILKNLVALISSDEVRPVITALLPAPERH